MSTIKHLQRSHASINEKATEDTQRKPDTRASWIQIRVLNEKSHPRRKPAEGEMQRI